MCMAAGLKPPTKVLVHGWLLVEGAKMAKSGGNGVDPIELVGRYGSDTVRYYLLREHALGADGDFSIEALENRYNVDLANNIGNLLSRVTNIVEKSLQGQAPPATGRVLDFAKVREHVGRASRAWGAFASAQALEEVQSLVRMTNSILEERAPWKVEDTREIGEILGDALEILRLVAFLVSPVLVDSAPRILQAIGIDGASLSIPYADSLEVGLYGGGVSISKAPPLFPRLRPINA